MGGIKAKNKGALARRIFGEIGVTVDPSSMFDCHIKRIHEYKRQLLNILRVIGDYMDIKENINPNPTPKTIIFGGKAAPGYFFAKLIIKLINSVADIINSDPSSSDFLKVVFIPNYRVSMAEIIIPAAELSEQISTAGMEASGTGNMKFAMNGALTIGTMDGANIEMKDYLKSENMFIFGLTESEIASMKPSYDPKSIYNSNLKVKKILDLINNGFFSPNEKDLFKPIVDKLLNEGDPYFVLADFDSYDQAHKFASELFKKPTEWTKKSIYNTAGMGYFSSDRTIKDYASNIWHVPFKAQS